MTDQSNETRGLLYVAPKEAPPSREPPPGTIGIIGWMRSNLFDGVLNTIATVLAAAFVIWFLNMFATWVIQDARWDVVITNITALNIGTDFDRDEIWRVQLIAMSVVVLSGISVGLWGGITRNILILIAVIMVMLVMVPLAANAIAPAPIRIIAGDNQNFTPMRFPADEGDTVEITIEALNDNSQARVEEYKGLFESAQGSANSRIAWSNIRRDVEEGDLELSDYFMQVDVHIFNGDGQFLETITLRTDEESVTLEYEVPETSWYIIRADVQDPTELQPLGSLQLPASLGEATGNAMITLDNVVAYSTKPDDLEDLYERYGDIPEVDDCGSNDAFGCQTATRILRYEGSRTFTEYIKIQVAPYFANVNTSIVISTIAFLLAYAGVYFARINRRETIVGWINRFAIIAWLLLIPVSWLILVGGVPTIESLDIDTVQGLTLTLVLTFISVAASLPLGVALALGRRSGLPVIGTFSTMFIELIRGAPLITILFFAANIVPFFFAEGGDLSDVIRMLIGLTLFSAAYQAEIVRGGLQIIPKGQTEAAQALGLNPFFTNTFIILPQALRAVIPATMSQFVSLFKDTSLVSIVGLFEIIGITKFITNGQPQFRPFVREAYLYVGIIYFIVAFIMSAVSRRLEETGSGAARRR